MNLRLENLLIEIVNSAPVRFHVGFSSTKWKLLFCFLQILFHKSCKLKIENIATGISTMLQIKVFMS